MVAFHWLWGPNYFGILNLNIDSTLWKIWVIAVDIVFISLVGVNLSNSSIRTPKEKWLKKYVIRGLKTFSYGLVITALSLFIVGQNFVKFGILHFIGLSIILAIPFFNYKKLNIVLGSMLIFFGVLLQDIQVKFSYLFWLGLQPLGFSSADYFPILPWFGVVLIGIAVGKIIYRDGKRQFKIGAQPEITKPFCWLGKKSLLIYFLHLVILFVAIYVIRLIKH